MFITNLLQNWTRSKNTWPEDYEQIVPQFDLADSMNKTIFQICLRGKNEDGEAIIGTLSQEFLSNIEHLKAQNPGWRYVLMGDKDAEVFIRDYYGERVLQYYHRIDCRYGAARADFLRCLLLYAQGGVYLDLKSTILTPLSESLGDDNCFCAFYWDNMPKGQRHCLIPETAPDGEYLMGIMASPSGHPYMREVVVEILKRIDHYDPYSVGVGWAGVLSVTGPAMFTEVVYRCREQIKNAPFRLAKAFQDFGYQVSFQEQNYIPGQYQKKTGLKNYRSVSVPVINSPDKWVQRVNVIYLWLLKELSLRKTNK